MYWGEEAQKYNNSIVIEDRKYSFSLTKTIFYKLFPTLYPLLQANCRLNPPVFPVTSITSPAKKSPGTVFDSKVSFSTSIGIHPPVIFASFQVR